MPLIPLLTLLIPALFGVGKVALALIALHKVENMLGSIGLGVVLFGVGAVCGALAYRSLKAKYPMLP